MTPFPPPPPVRPGAFKAAAVRRAAAWAIDFALVVVVAVALGSWTWMRIGALVTEIPSLAQNGAWNLFTSRDELPGGGVKGASIDFGLSLWDSAVGYVVQAFAALVLIVFAYHFIALAWKGRTLGKLVLDLRVESHRRARLGKGQALARASAATVSDVGLFALACCLLLQGWFLIAMLCWMLAVAVFWMNALPVLLPGHRTLHDRMTGTHVGRAHLYNAVAGRASQAGQGGRAAIEGALGKAKQTYRERRNTTPPG
jgi:uncharacterized RDD family membrane protein YckC